MGMGLSHETLLQQCSHTAPTLVRVLWRLAEWRASVERRSRDLICRSCSALDVPSSRVATTSKSILTVYDAACKASAGSSVDAGTSADVSIGTSIGASMGASMGASTGAS